MQRFPGITALLFILVALSVDTNFARELERYLIGPADLPADCQRLQGLFPLNDKVSKFYEGKAYRSVVPAPSDRHAQSFDCGGQKGTIYFYQYPTVNDQEQALLFARPILTQPAAAPSIVEWRGGFGVLSFAQTPEALRQRLLEKTGDGQTISASSTTPVAQSTATPVLISTPVIISPPVVISTPVPVASTPTKEKPNDISKDVVNKFRKSIDCRDRSLPEQLTQVCDWLDAFRKGETVAPVIASTDTLIGAAYRVDGSGQLRRAYFLAATGSGAIGEIHLVPIFPENGVDEIELQALVTRAPDQRPRPSDNLMRRITNVPRPTYRTFTSTQGKSWLTRLANQTLYLRQFGKQWIILALYDKTDESSDADGFAIISFN